MPGDRKSYEEAMNAGHNAAWDKEWSLAIAAYGQAVQQFPDEPEPYLYLGSALFETGKLDDALRVYTRAHQLKEDDPIPLEKSADILEKVGRLKDAAQQYVNVAEAYLKQRDIDKAIYNWDKATKLTPGLVAIHAKLAQAYERIGDKFKAIREYLTLAQNFQRLGDSDKAGKAAQRALRLDPKYAPTLNALRALETGAEVSTPSTDTPERPRQTGPLGRQPAAAKAGPTATPAKPTTPVKEAAVGDSDPLGPLGEAMTDALGLLATYVIEEGHLDAAGAGALQAMEFQRQGIQPQAIEAYKRAEEGLNHPALKMNLGTLLLLNNRADEALKYLGEATAHPQLAGGAAHALGRAFAAVNKHKQASRYLIQSLQMVDSALEPDEMDEAANLFEDLTSELDKRNTEVQSKVNNRLLTVLSGKEWKQRIGDFVRQLIETWHEQGVKGVVEILLTETQKGNELTDSVALIDRYMRQSLLTLAIDEAHRAVEFSPFYLPIHTRMAEIMMREGRVRQAITKYNVIAKTYMVRGENDRAASILSEVLEMAPLDISVRESLIELLESEQRWDEALDQYVDLADTHHQLGSFDVSRDIFVQAEKLAQRVNTPPEKIVRVKHRVADIDQMRLDMRKAQKTYEEIIQLVPNDERAHRMLIDIHYRQNNPVEATKKLDALLGIYAKSKQVNKITQLLEEQVTLYPNDTGLRSRLAAIYRQLNRKEDAIKQLDALAELQLEAGQHQDACATIRQIIALQPTAVEDYRKLAAQLGC